MLFEPFGLQKLLSFRSSTSLLWRPSIMVFELGHYTRTRHRSVQLERASVMTALMTSSGQHTVAPSEPNKRTSSLPLDQENQKPRPLSSHLRHHRSMLDVEIEEPPTLGPWKPMSFHELYVHTGNQSKIDDQNSAAVESSADTGAQSTQLGPEEANSQRLHASITTNSFLSHFNLETWLTLFS